MLSHLFVCAVTCSDDANATATHAGLFRTQPGDVAAAVASAGEVGSFIPDCGRTYAGCTGMFTSSN